MQKKNKLNFEQKLINQERNENAKINFDKK